MQLVQTYTDMFFTDMMFIKDDKFRYVFMNDSFCNFFGKSKDEIFGKSDYELFPSINLDNAHKSDMKVLIDGVPVSTIEIIDKNHFETTKFPVNFDNKSGIGGIIRNITVDDKKKNIIEAMFHISKCNLLETDLKLFFKQVHVQLGKIIPLKNIYIALYNKEFDTYSFPYFVDEYDKVEEDEMKVLHGSKTDYVRRSGKSQLIDNQTSEKLKEEEIIFASYGSISRVWLGSPLFDSELKEVTGVIAIQDYDKADIYTKEDITLFEIVAFNIGLFLLRVKDSEMLKKTILKAEQSELLEASFLANISHEIRTPMNGILGFSNILKEELTDNIYKGYLEIIIKCAERLLLTIDNLLLISKIESGQIEINMSEVDLNEVLNEMYFIYKDKNNKVEIRLSIRNNYPLIINTDKYKLEKILTNLIENAIKFTKEGHVEFGYNSNQEDIVLFIKDSGIGIPKEYHKTVFNRFVQVDTKRIHEFDGCGIGMTISKYFAQILGGEIWLESETNIGTTIFVRLPIKDQRKIANVKSNHMNFQRI